MLASWSTMAGLGSPHSLTPSLARWENAIPPTLLSAWQRRDCISTITVITVLWEATAPANPVIKLVQMDFYVGNFCWVQADPGHHSTTAVFK